MVPERGTSRRWTPRGWSALASMASHAACGIHPPRGLEAAVLHRLLAGTVHQALEGGLCPGTLSHLPELRSGPALPPLSQDGAVALGGEVGMGGCDGVVGTGGGGGPGGVLVVLCRGGAWGGGAWADVDSQVRAHGLRLGVGFEFVVAAVAGHLLDVGWHRGLVRGWGRCWWTVALFWPCRGWSVGLRWGLCGVAGRGASRLSCSALRHEGGGGGGGDGGGGLCWALLLPGLR